MVEVFKTNVQWAEEAKILLQKISWFFPKAKINFDLSDCDKILRIEGENICPTKIIELLKAENYLCSVLE